MKKLKEQRAKLQKTKALLEKRETRDKDNFAIEELENEIRAIDAQIEKSKINLEKREEKPMEKQLEQRKAVADYIRKAEVRDLNTSNGGIVVPTQLHNEIVEQLDEVAPLFGKVEKLTPVNGNLEILRETEKGEAGFVGENADLNIDNFAFDKVKLEQRRCGSAIKLTQKLINDSGIDIVDYSTDLLTRRLGKALDKAMIKGTVEGESFEGLESKIEDFEEVQCKGDVVTIDDYMNTLNAMYLDYQGGACWVMSRTEFNKLALLKDQLGNYYLIRDVIDGKPVYRLLGCEVLVSEDMEDVECKAFLINVSEAYAGMIKKGAELKRINADSQNALRGTELIVLDMYADVKIKNEKAVKVLKAA